jgi:hypothetical protein
MSTAWRLAQLRRRQPPGFNRNLRWSRWYAVGSQFIPSYIPVENYLAMLDDALN